MNDTSANMLLYYQKMIMSRSGRERMQMGFSMFDTAKQIAKSAILEHEPEISTKDMNKKIFLRFYGQEYSKEQKEKILEALR